MDSISSPTNPLNNRGLFLSLKSFSSPHHFGSKAPAWDITTWHPLHLAPKFKVFLGQICSWKWLVNLPPFQGNPPRNKSLWSGLIKHGFPFIKPYETLISSGGGYVRGGRLTQSWLLRPFWKILKEWTEWKWINTRSQYRALFRGWEPGQNKHWWGWFWCHLLHHLPHGCKSRLLVGKANFSLVLKGL